jgi:hypothetical protein
MTYGRWRSTTEDGRQIIVWKRFAYASGSPFTVTVGDTIILPPNAWIRDEQLVTVTGLGTDWDGPLATADLPASNPDRDCLCGGTVRPSDVTFQLQRNVTVHLECALRTTIGGIGHLRDHEFWCVEKGDPDAGKSFRESALEASAWLKVNGWDKAVGIR